MKTGFLVAAGCVAAVLLVSAGNTTLTRETVSGRINVTATLMNTTIRPQLPSGRAGDSVQQAWRVTDMHGHRVGRLLLSCRWVVTHQRLCSGELQMPLGKIAVSGASPTPLEGEYAVVGGTNLYRGGGGSMIWFAIGLRKNVVLVNIRT